MLALMHFRRINDNVVFVETYVLMQKYEGMKKAQSEFEKKAKVWQANSDTLVKQFEKELKSYEKERVHFSAKEKELSTHSKTSIPILIMTSDLINGSFFWLYL